MDSFYFEVHPKIIYPPCLSHGELQDCFHCAVQAAGKCPSPRGLCIKWYEGHKKGCPNYDRKDSCPPLAPMFDQVFDTEQTIYAIVSGYNLGGHTERMRERHPHWTERQQLNVLYWQGTARKELKHKILEFNAIFRKEGFYVTASPEAMGVDVTNTLSEVGFDLEWPARKTIYKVAMAGIPLSERYLSILN